MKVLKIPKLCLVAIMVLGAVVAYAGFSPQTLSAIELIGGACPPGDCKGTTDLVNCKGIIPACCPNYVVHLCEWEEDGPGICEENLNPDPPAMPRCWGPGDCDLITNKECIML